MTHSTERKLRLAAIILLVIIGMACVFYAIGKSSTVTEDESHFDNALECQNRQIAAKEADFQYAANAKELGIASVAFKIEAKLSGDLKVLHDAAYPLSIRGTSDDLGGKYISLVADAHRYDKACEEVMVKNTKEYHDSSLIFEHRDWKGEGYSFITKGVRNATADKPAYYWYIFRNEMVSSALKGSYYEVYVYAYKKPIDYRFVASWNNSSLKTDSDFQKLAADTLDIVSIFKLK